MRRRPAARLAHGALLRRRLLALAIVTAACHSGPPPPLQLAVRLVDHLDPAVRELAGADCAPFEERRPSLGCTGWKVRYNRPANPPATSPPLVLMPPADRDHPYADTQIARLVDTLERLGIASRTIVIVTADHGEEFGEHGKWSHGHTVYDELLRVPLMLWAPGRVPAGKRIRTPTSLTDLLPTVLDLVGLPLAEGIDGENQAPRIRGTAPEDPDRAVFAEVHPGDRNPDHMVAAHTLAEKWIFTDVEPPKAVAYDLVADRGEHTPLDDPARLDRGRGYLARYEAIGQDEGGAVHAPVGPVMEERLKALGYVQ